MVCKLCIHQIAAPYWISISLGEWFVGLPESELDKFLNHFMLSVSCVTFLFFFPLIVPFLLLE